MKNFVVVRYSPNTEGITSAWGPYNEKKANIECIILQEEYSDNSYKVYKLWSEPVKQAYTMRRVEE